MGQIIEGGVRWDYIACHFGGIWVCGEGFGVIYGKCAMFALVIMRFVVKVLLRDLYS